MGKNGKGDAENGDIEERPRSLLIEMAKQLHWGMDLSRVTFPTFILEPRSLLEKWTDFLIHSRLLLRIGEGSSPMDRMKRFLAWFVAGFHHMPKAPKKPYNPILGEIFVSHFDHGEKEVCSGDCSEGGSRTTYIAEQVSHHPPISAFYFSNRKGGIVCNGWLYTKSRFYGNKVASVLEGRARLFLVNHPGEYYEFTFPTAYAKGLFFGKLHMEIGGSCQIRCPRTRLSAKVEFKPRSLFQRKYGQVAGSIFPDEDYKHPLEYLTGNWTGSLYASLSKGNKDELLACFPDEPKCPRVVRPLDTQRPNESRRLWRDVEVALKAQDQIGATNAKTVLEEAQRKGVRDRASSGTVYKNRYFNFNEQTGDWVYNHINIGNFHPREGDIDLMNIRALGFSCECGDCSLCGGNDDLMRDYVKATHDRYINELSNVSPNFPGETGPPSVVEFESCADSASPVAYGGTGDEAFVRPPTPTIGSSKEKDKFAKFSTEEKAEGSLEAESVALAAKLATMTATEGVLKSEAAGDLTPVTPTVAQAAGVKVVAPKAAAPAASGEEATSEESSDEESEDVDVDG